MSRLSDHARPSDATPFHHSFQVATARHFIQHAWFCSSISILTSIKTGGRHIKSARGWEEMCVHTLRFAWHLTQACGTQSDLVFCLPHRKAQLGRVYTFAWRAWTCGSWGEVMCEVSYCLWGEKTASHPAATRQDSTTLPLATQSHVLHSHYLFTSHHSLFPLTVSLNDIV